MANLGLANREGKVLLTGDKDFGEIAYRQRRLLPGVILVRLAGLSPSEKANVVAGVMDEHEAELPRAFTVIGPKTVRIRR